MNPMTHVISERQQLAMALRESTTTVASSDGEGLVPSNVAPSPKRTQKEPSKAQRTTKRKERHSFGTPLPLRVPEGVDSWSSSRKRVWKGLKNDPNLYYYWYPPPGVERKEGTWDASETTRLLSIIETRGLNYHWGYISMHLPGRTGFDCKRFFCRHISGTDLESQLLADYRIAHLDLLDSLYLGKNNPKPLVPPPDVLQQHPDLAQSESAVESRVGVRQKHSTIQRQQQRQDGALGSPSYQQQHASHQEPAQHADASDPLVAQDENSGASQQATPTGHLSTMYGESNHQLDGGDDEFVPKKQRFSDKHEHGLKKEGGQKEGASRVDSIVHLGPLGGNQSGSNAIGTTRSSIGSRGRGAHSVHRLAEAMHDEYARHTAATADAPATATTTPVTDMTPSTNNYGELSNVQPVDESRDINVQFDQQQQLQGQRVVTAPSAADNTDSSSSSYQHHQHQQHYAYDVSVESMGDALQISEGAGGMETSVYDPFAFHPSTKSNQPHGGQILSEITPRHTDDQHQPHAGDEHLQDVQQVQKEEPRTHPAPSTTTRRRTRSVRFTQDLQEYDDYEQPTGEEHWTSTTNHEGYQYSLPRVIYMPRNMLSRICITKYLLPNPSH